MFNKRLSVASNIKFVRVAVVLMLVLLMFGCAGNTYTGPDGKILPPSLGETTKILESSQAVYNTTLQMAGQLHCSGKIDRDTALKIVEVGEFYYVAHQTAKSGLSAWYDAYYIEGADPENAKLNTKALFLNLADQAIVLAEEYETLTGETLPIPMDLTVSAIKALFGG